MLRAVALDCNLVRWTGFSAVVWMRFMVARRPYHHTLSLTTIGSRTGALRSVALPYWEIDGDLIVCGTNAGGPKDPHWVGNIRANSHCWVHVHRTRIPAYAHLAESAERATLLEWIDPEHPDLRHYQKLAMARGRDVPVVVITPRQPCGPHA